MSIPTQKQRDDIMEAWASHRGLKKSQTKIGGLRFLRPKMTEYTDLRFPGADHVSYWNKNGKPFCVVSQPYNIDDKVMVEVVDICKKHNLKCFISAGPSWHYPGGVFTMLWVGVDEKGPL